MDSIGDQGVFIPWGAAGGVDDVWFGKLWGRGVDLMAGDDTEGHAERTKAGDLVHDFRGGSIQMITGVVVDRAGNAWAANNWNESEAVADGVDPTRVGSPGAEARASRSSVVSQAL